MKYNFLETRTKSKNCYKWYTYWTGIRF